MKEDIRMMKSRGELSENKSIRGNRGNAQN